MTSLKSLTLNGFKSFGRKTVFLFEAPVTAIVGPNGSGKSNVAEAFRFVLGEQSLKALRGRRGEDLIFNGGSGATRAARASATVVLDNHNRRFALDFDEITITREVYRDGVNGYFLNGNQVRLRDINELLLGGSLPPSGYHLISQGEADRLLSADVGERRELVEDALGLRLYQWKVSESEKKLARTADNIRQVESLRRELAPHLRFLQKEVDKIKQADELRRHLKQLYFDYFKAENHYRRAEEARLREEGGELKRRLLKARAEVAAATQTNSTESEATARWRQARATLLADRQAIRARADELARRRGRLEAEAEWSRRPVAASPIDGQVLKAWLVRWRQWLDRLGRAGSLDEAHNLAREGDAYLAETAAWTGESPRASEQPATQEAVALLDEEAAAIAAAETALTEREVELERSIEETRQTFRAADANRFRFEAAAEAAAAQLAICELKQKELAVAVAALKQEQAEAAALVDREVLDFETSAVIDVAVGADRVAMERRRREIEKYKLRLEDLQVASSETMREFEETKSRDEYLNRELADLQAAANSLESIRRDLLAKIDREFREGVEKINQSFQNFFTLMFGGGEAEILLTDRPRRKRSDAIELEEASTEGETQTGIDIKVNLPRKRIKSLEMLSGGERSLVSIALLFAMSQVNPPPFLILDETDAALDEANSRKYGEMIENLARQSQLILITHNRETMSRAGVIYGVTLSREGSSQLLSIKFDDAVSYAKA